MTTKIKVSELAEFDAAEYLSSEADVAAYLTTVLEENDSALLAAALGVRLVAQPVHTST
jgi:probable addiction module antidote protein